jgi:hypothetical protein
MGQSENSPSRVTGAFNLEEFNPNDSNTNVDDISPSVIDPFDDSSDDSSSKESFEER